MRVVRVVTQGSRQGSYGGPFDTSLNQARLLAASGFEVVVVASYIDGDEPHLNADRLGSGSVQVHMGRACRLFGYGPPTMVSWSIAKILYHRISSADVVIISFGREIIPVLAVVLANFQGKAIVLQTHGMLEARKSALHRAIDLLLVRPLFRTADTCIALTSKEQKHLERYSTIRPQFRILGNPVLKEAVESGESKDMAPNNEEVLFLGRLYRRKGIATFCDAASYAEVRQLLGHYRVVGPDQGELEKVRQTESATEGRLRYEGAIPGSQVARRLERCRVFVLPSHREPWGNVLIAAVYLGKPVIVSSNAYLADELVQAGCAIAVEEGDARGFAEAADRVLRDSLLEASMRDAAREFARSRLSPVATAKELDTIVRSAKLGSYSRRQRTMRALNLTSLQKRRM